MSAKKIVITGGAGFVGTNLIKYFLEKTKLNIISIDNYSSSSKRNHIKSSRVRYIKAHTKNISTVLNPKKIHSIFHFGEFARIYQSFLQMDKCIDSNSIGTNAVINFCLNQMKSSNTIILDGPITKNFTIMKILSSLRKKQIVLKNKREIGTTLGATNLFNIKKKNKLQTVVIKKYQNQSLQAIYKNWEQNLYKKELFRHS